MHAGAAAAATPLSAPPPTPTWRYRSQAGAPSALSPPPPPPSPSPPPRPPLLFLFSSAGCHPALSPSLSMTRSPFDFISVIIIQPVCVAPRHPTRPCATDGGNMNSFEGQLQPKPKRILWPCKHFDVHSLVCVFLSHIFSNVSLLSIAKQGKTCVNVYIKLQ